MPIFQDGLFVPLYLTSGAIERVVVTELFMIVLFTLTAFFVLGIAGTVGKLLFDDWRVRQLLRFVAPAIPPAP